MHGRNRCRPTSLGLQTSSRPRQARIPARIAATGRALGDPVGMKWSPLKAALVTFGSLLAVGLVIGVVVGARVEGDAFERGRRFGQGLGMFATLSAVVAYLIQKQRVR